MESKDIKIKRKIRKTRRSLNEIRRRANTKSRDNNKRKFITQTPIILTTNRLSLFNKAVRSETVTRAYIPKRNTKPSTVVNESGNSTNLTLLQNQNEDIEVVNNSPLIKEDKNNLSTIIPRTASAKDCKEQFSPLQSGTSNTLFSESLQSCITSNSFAALQTDDDCHIYELNENEFMKNISKYIRKVAPGLLSTDIIHEQKTTLGTMYSDDLTHLNDTLQCYNSSSSGKTIIQNVDCGSRNETSSSLDSPVYPLCSLTCDSPEFHFYPHKLNQ